MKHIDVAATPADEIGTDADKTPFRRDGWTPFARRLFLQPVNNPTDTIRNLAKTTIVSPPTNPQYRAYVVFTLFGSGINVPARAA